MTAPIAKQSYNSYEQVSSAISKVDNSWDSLPALHKFIFTKYQGKIYYINATNKVVDEIYGPLDIVSMDFEVLHRQTTYEQLVIPTSLIEKGPLIVYIRTAKDELSMAFISNQAIVIAVDKPIVLGSKPLSSITINNSGANSIYYSYENTPTIPPAYKEIPSNVIEVFEPRSIGYLYIIDSTSTPISFTTTNPRTKLVDTHFLLVIPNNFSKAQAAKLTGNSIGTITDSLDLYIEI